MRKHGRERRDLPGEDASRHERREARPFGRRQRENARVLQVQILEAVESRERGRIDPAMVGPRAKDLVVAEEDVERAACRLCLSRRASTNSSTARSSRPRPMMSPICTTTSGPPIHASRASVAPASRKARRAAFEIGVQVANDDEPPRHDCGGDAAVWSSARVPATRSEEARISEASTPVRNDRVNSMDVVVT